MLDCLSNCVYLYIMCAFRKLTYIVSLCFSQMIWAGAQSEKPNVVIVLGDDISSNTIGCYGSLNPNTTPNIDRLATEGVQFTNMFVAQATCAPTRAELYTGLRPFHNGTYMNHRPAKTGTKSMTHHLGELGYRVGLAGKVHVRPKSVYDFEYLSGFQKNCNHFGPAKDNWDQVEQFMTRDQEQPFCLVLASTHAHAPWDAGDSSHWKLDDVVLPPALVDTPETRSYFREYLAEVREFDRQVGDTRAMLQKHGLDKNTVLIVLDENGIGMPGGKWTNYDWGVRSACVMKLPSTYNKPMKTSVIAQYCDVLPTLIELAGGEVPEGLDGKSLVKVLRGEAETHREYAYFVNNAETPNTPFSSRAITDGRYKLIWTLTPENPFVSLTINGFQFGFKDRMEDRHVRKMFQSWQREEENNAHAEEMIRRFETRPEFQLFDLDADPGEMKNLANNREYASICESLLIQLKRIMEEQDDLGSDCYGKGRKQAKK